ncbi:TPA: hypothetical protein NKS35_004597 [Vibrio parahaemolyticus]|nr:hypothetical protein [Vibrio parahaemolyticus]
MKQVRMLYKRLNFNSTAAGRFKMKASLKHSLRIVDEHNSFDKEDGQEWNENLTDNNLVFIGGDLKTFAEFSEEERESFLDSCFAPTQPNNKKALQKTRSAYGKKLENAIEKETNPIAKEMLEAIKEVPLHQMIENHLLQRLHNDDVQMVRKSQRLTMVQKYADAHNALTETVNKKSTYIQEGLFKFPKPKDKNVNELTDELSAEDYIFHMERFLKEHFPEHETKAIFCHVDEAKIHSHYYLSGANSKTNELDLHKRELEIVNDYIRKVTDPNNIDVELIPTDKKLSFGERQRFGRYFQRLFFDYTNENLLYERGVIATITEESERKSDLSKQRNAEAKLPKSQRSHNYATHQAELAEKKTLDAEQRLVSVNTEIANVEKQLQSKRMERFVIEKTIEDRKFSLEEVETELATNRDLLDMVNSQIEEAKQYLSDFQESFFNAVGNVTKNIYVRAIALLKGNQSGAEQYAQRILQEYSEIAPEPLRDICKSAAKAVEDIELESRMKRKDQTMDLNK